MLVVALLGAPIPLGLMVWFVAVAAPALANMLSEFGGPLPFPTLLVLSRWWGPAMIAAYLLGFPLTLVFPKAYQRDFALVGVVLIGALAAMASTACLYLPIFQLAPIQP